jgi:ABC-2 type transport system permease protein
LILWGFISKFFVEHSSWLAQASGVLMAAVLLWDVLFRAHLGVSLAFFEEMYSRNLGHLFVSPLRVSELTGALLAISFLRTLIGIGGAALLAIPLYNFSIFGLGLPLLGFFANLLVMGWSIGLLVAGMVLRYGLGAESFAWVSIFAIAPLSGIYYPVSTLPAWLQPVSWLLPSSYVFEGMRQVMFGQVVRTDLMWQAVGLNFIYLALGAGFFLLAFHSARRNGLLLRVGE